MIYASSVASEKPNSAQGTNQISNFQFLPAELHDKGKENNSFHLNDRMAIK